MRVTAGDAADYTDDMSSPITMSNTNLWRMVLRRETICGQIDLRLIYMRFILYYYLDML